MAENVKKQSDVAEREVIFPGTYGLRLIAPKAASVTEPGVVNPLGAATTVLAQTLYAKPLPVSHEPTSPDFHEGNYVLRLNDAGDWTIGFPNRDASDGQPWRSRFSSDGHKQFIEISREGEVEFVGTIVKIVKDRQKIVVSGYDGFWLLKKAYEKEYRGIIAPRDLLERYTRVDVVPVVTTFLEAKAPAGWTSKVATKEGFAKVEYTVEGARLIAESLVPGAANSGTITLIAPKVSSGSVNVPTWNAQMTFLRPSNGQKGESEIAVIVTNGGEAFPPLARLGIIFHGTTSTASLLMYRDVEQEKIILPVTIGMPTTGDFTLELVCDGRWIFGYINGSLVGYVKGFTATELQLELSAIGQGTELEAGKEYAVVGQTFLRIAKPFLLRGSNKGDYVLPGSAATYPYGGLHADYYSHGGSATGWQETVLAPDPRNPEPGVWQEPTISYAGAGPWTPPPSACKINAYFAVRWYGAVYLDLEHNTEVTFTIANLDDGARLWVGKTLFGEQIIDEWKEGGSRTVEGKVTAAALGAKKGWFPIILEYFNGAGSSGIVMQFKATTGWTDPGGTVIAGETATVVPSTSLSPLGCFNEPIQGQSHFDIIQNTAKQFGYQLALKHEQLESGNFPGQLIPLARQGKDFNEVIEADDIDRRSGINNYTYTLDATDSATSIRALGSGIADGKGSQVAFETLSPEAVEEALFDIQAFISEGNVAEPQLLAALAEAQLALRLGSWDNLSGEPIARDRLADTFPLTGKLSLLKWRAGDGVRVWLPDVGVEDTTPRAIMQVTRTFGPEGRIGTQIGFRSRPKDHLYALRQLLRSLSLPQRSSQGVYEDVPGSVVFGKVGIESFSGASAVPLFPQDRVINARVRLTENTAGENLVLFINGKEVTNVGGPWAHSPVEIPCISAVAPASSTNSKMYAQFKTGAKESEVEFQLILTVLRA